MKLIDFGLEKFSTYTQIVDVPTIGIIGAGQLARMALGPATDLGVNVKVFASNSDDSAAQIAVHDLQIAKLLN